MFFTNQEFGSLDVTSSRNFVNVVEYVFTSLMGVKSDCPKPCCKLPSNANNLILNSGIDNSGKSWGISPSALYFLYTFFIFSIPLVVLTLVVKLVALPLDDNAAFTAAD